MIATIAQGPVKALRQVFDMPGHFRLARAATRRVWRSSRTIAAAIAFTVISWTAAETAVYSYESGRSDLLLLTKSRRLGEVALEQGILAGLTSLRDVAGLGDNLPLLIVAAIVVFRASIDPQKSGGSGRLAGRVARPRPGLDHAGVGGRRVVHPVPDRLAGGRIRGAADGGLPDRRGGLDPDDDAGRQRPAAGLDAGRAAQCRARHRG